VSAGPRPLQRRLATCRRYYDCTTTHQCVLSVAASVGLWRIVRPEQQHTRSRRARARATRSLTGSSRRREMGLVGESTNRGGEERGLYAGGCTGAVGPTKLITDDVRPFFEPHRANHNTSCRPASAAATRRVVAAAFAPWRVTGEHPFVRMWKRVRSEWMPRHWQPTAVFTRPQQRRAARDSARRETQ
jgi:hypothetical protein